MKLVESPTAPPRDPRTHSLSRRLGYRLLPGEGYSYILHTRPREWPIVAAHAFFGFVIAIPDAPQAAERWPQALLGVAVFVMFLNAGTLAINSAFDRDEGDIGYLDAPPPPPRHLFAFGMALMIAGLFLAARLLPFAFTALYAGCLGMSVLYSVPPFRWKAVAGADLAINAIGIGALTALAGWTTAAVPLPIWAALVLAGFAPLFAALYPLTQIYQIDEDRQRGDRTLALALGTHRALQFALAMTVLAFALISVGLAIGPAGSATLVVGVPAAVWLTILLRWLRRHPTMRSEEHKRGMYAALQAWAVTDVAVGAAVLLPYLLNN